MLDKARSYLGQTFIGTNSSDRGQCVGLVNKVVLDVTGLLYPLKGAVGAKDLITCTNTRPDLFTQVRNDPKNPSQLPSIGDWVIWGATWGNGYGHVSCVEVVSSVGFTGIEQNFVANKVTRQQHNWSGVTGWIHVVNNNQGVDIMDRQAVIDAYLTVRGSHPSEAEIAGWVGKPAIMLVRGFKNEADQARNNYSTAIKNLQTALANEQAKPPKEVVKEVEKIVEKIVTVEKPVEVVVEPSWLVSVREAIKTFLKIK